MKVLLIIAHGSRSRTANAEVAALAQQLTDADSGFDRIDFAYLEIAEPRINAAIALLAEEGASAVTIFPYFLAGGAHVAVDIPAQLAEAQKLFPRIRFSTLPHFGAMEGIPELILHQISRAL